MRGPAVYLVWVSPTLASVYNWGIRNLYQVNNTWFRLSIGRSIAGNAGGYLISLHLRVKIAIREGEVN